MTGGGFIGQEAATAALQGPLNGVTGPKAGDKVTHGFELYCGVASRKRANNLEVNWGKGNNFKLIAMTSVNCFDDPSIASKPKDANFDTLTGTGAGLYNGKLATISWTFTDSGEPGKSDVATMVIKDGLGNVVLSVNGPLKSGNQQADK